MSFPLPLRQRTLCDGLLMASDCSTLFSSRSGIFVSSCKQCINSKSITIFNSNFILWEIHSLGICGHVNTNFIRTVLGELSDWRKYHSNLRIDTWQLVISNTTTLLENYLSHVWSFFNFLQNLLIWGENAYKKLLEGAFWPDVESEEDDHLVRGDLENFVLLLATWLGLRRYCIARRGAFFLECNYLEKFIDLILVIVFFCSFLDENEVAPLEQKIRLLKNIQRIRFMLVWISGAIIIVHLAYSILDIFWKSFSILTFALVHI